MNRRFTVNLEVDNNVVSDPRQVTEIFSAKFGNATIVLLKILFSLAIQFQKNVQCLVACLKITYLSEK